ncbi:MAG: argininosuccinate lyase, partial [Planctomycetes bacterium]|nr:argininosuccinate lyase [Planctomycetota bacterium]
MGNGGDGRGRAAGGKAWGGRFREPTDPAVERLNASIGFDIRLARHDVEGSIAHARMLGRRGIIPPADARAIERGLRQVAREVETGRFQPTVGDEDVHMAIERRLVELIGPAGKRLHTGRSRNDQVALDTRLYLREASGEIRAQVHALIRCLLTAAERHASVLMPAYTHLQPAQPVLFAHHLCAYGEMLARDLARLRDAAGRADEMALGSGACTGTTFPLDREAVRRALGFARLTRNSLDAVADRDFILEFEAAAAILMMHLSRLAEELILWSSREFGFVEFSDAVTTGSSMMPQKRNLDGAELVRGKAGRVFGRLLALLTTMKGLPLAYNKDLQEDKE